MEYWVKEWNYVIYEDRFYKKYLYKIIIYKFYKYMICRKKCKKKEMRMIIFKFLEVFKY